MTLLQPTRILVTGTAGFIGFHLARRLAGEGHTVLGIDNLSPYYDVRLKEARLAILDELPGYSFRRLDLADGEGVAAAFADFRPEIAVNLAAQAGVRYSLTDPHTYASSNLSGFLSILEACRHHPVKHLIYASSSSVYGANTDLPYRSGQNVDHPVSLYAATKKANELMAHAYSHLFAIPATGLRFFTVYGPWGRPDMALYKFTQAILGGEPIQVFNNGDMERDFTYVDDIVEGMVRLLGKPPAADPQWRGDAPDPASSYAPYRIYNIGNNQPVNLLTMIGILERCLGKEAEKHFLPMQPGDIKATFADIDDLARDVDFRPATTLETGIRAFVDWYRDYHTT